MSYTLKISDISPKAISIINMLKTLATDYDFMQIYKDEDYAMLTAEQKKELDSRYEYVLKNPTVGKPWNAVKQNLLSK